MKPAIFVAIIIASAALGASTVNAKEESVAGTWTLTVEQRIGLALVLDQKGTTVTGTLDWPHGDPIKLTGQLAGHTLTFSGDTNGENFTLHIDSTASLTDDGALTGTLKAHFTDFNDAHQVQRTTDQEIPWTAMRGLHDVVHFPR
jgi:hypothetical protein